MIKFAGWKQLEWISYYWCNEMIVILKTVKIYHGIFKENETIIHSNLKIANINPRYERI